MADHHIILSRETIESVAGDRWTREEIEAVTSMLERYRGKFPRGVKTIPGDLISALQRERLIRAVLREAAVAGYRPTTVETIVARAAVSRPTFYAHFQNKEHAFLVALGTATERLEAELTAAVAASDGKWHERLRAGIDALLGHFAEQPDVARSLVLETRAAGADTMRLRDAMMDRCARAIDAAVAEQLPRRASPVTAVGVVGGMEAVFHRRLSAGRDLDRERLLPALVYFAVLSYEGHEAAARAIAAKAG